MGIKLLNICADEYPPFRVDVDVLFAKALTARGFEIDWILRDAQPRAEDGFESWYGGRAWVGRHRKGRSFFNKLWRLIDSVRIDLKCLQLAKDNDYDVVQVKDKFLAFLPALYLRKRYGCKLSYWLSFPYPEAAFYHAKREGAPYPVLDRLRGVWLHFLLYNVILPRCDIAFVQSDAMREDIIQKGVAPDKLVAVPMGVDWERLSVIERPEVPSDRAVVYLGDMGRARRIDFLLQVMAKVIEQVPEARLHLVGGAKEPADEQMLKDLVKTLNIERAVSFHGWCSMDVGWKVAAGCAVGVSPINDIPMYRVASPTKLVEYLALGLPSVANDHPDQQTVISESQAGRCVPYDEAAFVEAIVDLLQLTPDERQRLGLQGRDYVNQNRSYRVLADQVERCFQALLPEALVSSQNEELPEKTDYTPKV